MTTEEALEESIKHWEDNKKNPATSSIESDNCALCKKFVFNRPFKDAAICKGCPVAERTKVTQCKKTPYYDARMTWGIMKNIPSEENIAAFKVAAQAEIDFLKSLRTTELSYDI